MKTHVQMWSLHVESPPVVSLNSINIVLRADDPERWRTVTLLPCSSALCVIYSGVACHSSYNDTAFWDNMLCLLSKQDIGLEQRRIIKSDWGQRVLLDTHSTLQAETDLFISTECTVYLNFPFTSVLLVMSSNGWTYAQIFQAVD